MVSSFILLLFFIAFATPSIFIFLSFGGSFFQPGYIHMINLKPENHLFSNGVISIGALPMNSRLQCMQNGGQLFTGLKIIWEKKLRPTPKLFQFMKKNLIQSELSKKCQGTFQLQYCTGDRQLSYGCFFASIGVIA